MKNLFKKDPYPQSPKDWDNAELTLYRKFTFRSTPDIECLMRLVKDNLYDGGNERYLRARLLGILRSMYSDANAEFWTRYKHPKTWRIRMFMRNVRQWYHRTFKTRQFKSNVSSCNIARKVMNKIMKDENISR